MLLFKHEMVPLIREGRKVQTRRYWKRPRVKVGSIHIVNTDYVTWTGLRVRILRVWETVPEAISEDEARAEGFESREEFLEYLARIHARQDRAAEGRRCYAVEFELWREGS